VGTFTDFYQITELKLNNNRIKFIGEISSFQKLKTLDLSFNFLNSTGRLVGLPKLTNLSLQSNKLTEIDSVLNLTSIKILDVSLNNLTRMISLQKHKGLKKLTISLNEQLKKAFIEYLPILDHRLFQAKTFDIFYESFFIISNIGDEQVDCEFTLSMLKNGFHYNLFDDNQVNRFIASCHNAN
jgi:Leucine-rich repeat (LRR) protein